MNSSIIKCSLYVIIAALTYISPELSHIQNLAELTSAKIMTLGVGTLLQCAIAIRAFLDQSISNEKSDQDNKPS